MRLSNGARSDGGVLISLRQLHRERRSGTWLAIHGHMAMVGLDNVFHERESQSAAFNVMHQSCAYAIELVEYFLVLFLSDSDAAVSHRKGDPPFLLRDSH